MEEESFEDEEVARLLNDSFVSIKVDKEERPDIDAVYMAVCQAFTGQGGWPTTILTTPDQKPFFAGTYFPKGHQYNNPGLMDILEAAREAWQDNPAKLAETGDQVAALLAEASKNKTASGSPGWEKTGPSLIDKAAVHFDRSFDSVWGGFGKAPKFPAAHQLLFLMKLHRKQRPESADSAAQGIGVLDIGAVTRLGKRDQNASTRELEMVEKTLLQMYAGGLYDHIGGGFSRYSTDEKWLVPHFEKMLYDNALLCMAYTECWKITGKPLYRRVAEEILDYVAAEMRGPEGGFYSAQDADSEGEEGKFYVFTPEEVCSVLGEETGRVFCEYYDITEEGNFEGRSIPNLINTLKRTPEKIFGLEEEPYGGLGDGTEEYAEKKRFHREMDEARKKLYAYRKQRAQLYTDDKVLTSWNSLMIAAYARACQVFGKKEYLAIAREAETFLREKLMEKDGGLRVRYREGEAVGGGFLDDYAFYEWALLELLCAEHKATRLQRAMEIEERMTADFVDRENGGFYLTGNEQEQLIFRPKETYDGAIPSGNSVAAYAMIRLYEKMPGSEKRRKRIEEQLAFFCAAAEEHPAGSAFGLTALLEWERWLGNRRG